MKYLIIIALILFGSSIVFPNSKKNKIQHIIIDSIKGEYNHSITIDSSILTDINVKILELPVIETDSLVEVIRKNESALKEYQFKNLWWTPRYRANPFACVCN